MGNEGDTGLLNHPHIVELKEYPGEEDHNGWQFYTQHEKQQTHYSRSRQSSKMRSHYPGNGSAGSHQRNGRPEMRQNIYYGGNYPTEQVEYEELNVAHDVLNIGAKGVEEEHIAKKMNKASVHEHVRQQR